MRRIIFPIRLIHDYHTLSDVSVGRRGWGSVVATGTYNFNGVFLDQAEIIVTPDSVQSVLSIAALCRSGLRRAVCHLTNGVETSPFVEGFSSRVFSVDFMENHEYLLEFDMDTSRFLVSSDVIYPLGLGSANRQAGQCVASYQILLGFELILALGHFFILHALAGSTSRQALHETVTLYKSMTASEQDCIQQVLTCPHLDSGKLFSLFLQRALSPRQSERQQVSVNNWVDLQITWLLGQQKVDLPYSRQRALAILAEDIDTDKKRVELYRLLRDYDRTVERGNIERLAGESRKAGQLLIFGRMSRAFHNQASLFADSVLVKPVPEWRVIADELPQWVNTNPSLQAFAGDLLLLLTSVQEVPLTQMEGLCERFEEAVVDVQKSLLLAEIWEDRQHEGQTAPYSADQRQTEIMTLTLQRLQLVGRIRNTLLTAERRPATFVVISQRPSPTGSHLLIKINELQEPYPGKSENLLKLARLSGDRLYSSPDYGWLEVADHWIEAIPLFIKEQVAIENGVECTKTFVDTAAMEESFREEMADFWALNLRDVLERELLGLARQCLGKAQSAESDEDFLGQGLTGVGQAEDIAALGVLLAEAYRQRVSDIHCLIERESLIPFNALKRVLLESELYRQTGELVRTQGSWYGAVKKVLLDSSYAGDFNQELNQYQHKALQPPRPLPALHILTTQSAGMTDGYIRSWLEESMALFNIVDDLGLHEAVSKRQSLFAGRMLGLGKTIIRELGIWVEVEELRINGLSEAGAIQQIINHNRVVKQELSVLGVLIEYQELMLGHTIDECVVEPPAKADSIFKTESVWQLGLQASWPSLDRWHQEWVLEQVYQRNADALNASLRTDSVLENESVWQVEALRDIVLTNPTYREDLAAYTCFAARRQELTRLDAGHPHLFLQELAKSYCRRYQNLAKTTARKQIIAERKLNHLTLHPFYYVQASGGSKRYHLLYTPSRVDLGHRERESVESWSQWVGGADASAARVGRELFSLINKDVRVFESLTEPEILKTGENASMTSHFGFSNALSLMIAAASHGDFEAMGDNMNSRRDRLVHPAGEGYGGYCVPKDGLFLEFVLGLSRGEKLGQLGLPVALHGPVTELAHRLLDNREQFDTDLEWQEWAASQLALDATALSPPGGLEAFQTTRLAHVLDSFGQPELRDPYRLMCSLSARWGLHKMVTGGEQVNRFMPFYKVWLIRQGIIESQRRNSDTSIKPENAVVVLTAEYKPDTQDGRFAVGMRKFEILAGTGGFLIQALDIEGQNLALLMSGGFAELESRGRHHTLLTGLGVDAMDDCDKPLSPAGGGVEGNTVEINRHSGMDRRNPDCRDAKNPCHPWSLGSGDPCRNDGETPTSSALGVGARGFTVLQDDSNSNSTALPLKLLPKVEKLRTLFPPYPAPAEIRLVSTTGLVAQDLLNYTSDTQLEQIANEVRNELESLGISGKEIDANLRTWGPRLAMWDVKIGLTEYARALLQQQLGGRLQALALQVVGPERSFDNALCGADVLDTGIPHRELLKLVGNPARLCRLMMKGNPHSALVIIDGASGARHRAMNRQDVMLWFAAGEFATRQSVYQGIGLGSATVESWRKTMQTLRTRAEKLFRALANKDSLQANALYEGIVEQVRNHREAQAALAELDKLRRIGRDRERDHRISRCLARVSCGLPLAELAFDDFLSLGGIYIFNGATVTEIKAATDTYWNGIEHLGGKPLREAHASAALLESDDELAANLFQQEQGFESSNKATEDRTVVALQTRQRLANRIAQACALNERKQGFLTVTANQCDFVVSHRKAIDSLKFANQPIKERDFGAFLGHARIALQQLVLEQADHKKVNEKFLELISQLITGHQTDLTAWDKIAGGYEDIGEFGRLAQQVVEDAELGITDPAHQAGRLRHIALGGELFYIILAIESTLPFTAHPPGNGNALSLWRALANFFAKTINDHAYEYRPWLYSRGIGFGSFTGEPLYELANEHHCWLYRYLLLVITHFTEVRELSPSDQQHLLGLCLDGFAVEPIGGEAEGSAEKAWRCYGQLRELAFIRNDGFALPEVFVDFDPDWIEARQRVNHVIAAPVGRTHFSRVLREGPTLARQLEKEGRLGANLIITRKAWIHDSPVLIGGGKPVFAPPDSTSNPVGFISEPSTVKPLSPTNTVELATEVGRNKPAPAGVSGKLTGPMPETVASRPYSGLRQNLNSTVLLSPTPHPSGGRGFLPPSPAGGESEAKGAEPVGGEGSRFAPAAANSKPTLYIHSGHLTIDQAAYQTALVSGKGYSAEAAARQSASQHPKGVRIAARFVRPVLAALVYPFHGDPLYESGGLEECGLPYTVQSRFHTWTTYDKAKYTDIFKDSGVDMPAEIDWLASYTAQIAKEPLCKQSIRGGLAGTPYLGLIAFADQYPLIMVKDAAESGGRGAAAFQLRDADGQLDLAQVERATDFIYQLSLRHNVTIQEAVLSSPEHWATEEFMRNFTHRQIVEWGSPVNRRKYPKTAIYGSHRIILSTDSVNEPDALKKWHVSHWITLNSKQLITNIGRGGTLDLLRPETIRGEHRNAILAKIAEAGRKVMEALGDYESKAGVAYEQETGRKVGVDLLNVSYGSPRYMMLDFLITPQFAETGRLVEVITETDLDGSQSQTTFIVQDGSHRFPGHVVDWRVVLIEPNIGVGLWDRVALREEFEELEQASAEGRNPNLDRIGENARIVIKDLHRAGEEYLQALIGRTLTGMG